MASRSSLALCFAIVLVLAISPAQSYQQYQSSIPNGSGVPCPPEDPTCEENGLCVGVGYETCAEGMISPKSNAFGKDFEAAGLEWSRELCEKDSDGDGFSNGYELGDPCCIWQEGGEIPSWMLEWAVSHPGSAQSTQIPDENVDLEGLCEKAGASSRNKLYNVGEDQITQEYFTEEHTIANRQTVYTDFRFNFPDDQTYYIVGIDTLSDNEEMVYHMVVKGCSIKADETEIGKAHSLFGNKHGDCQETLFLWSPGELDFALPLVSGFPVGKGTNRVGFVLRIHYDNPMLKEGETDASGIRFHMTTTPRKYEAGILATGTVLSVGVIPPKTKAYSLTIFQMKVDEEVAPDGVTVFGYFPYMHELGRRMWTEKLERKSGSKGMLKDFLELEKVGDIARDDEWKLKDEKMVPVDGTTIKNGDFISTTCLFDSTDRTEVTIGNITARDEVCVGYLTFYPSGAVDSALIHSGPRLSGEMTDQAFESVKSVVEIMENPVLVGENTTGFPIWREAYLKGELECDEDKMSEVFNPQKGIYIGRKDYKKLGGLCGSTAVTAMFFGHDVVEEIECSQECAAEVFGILGCGLLKEGKQSNGETLPLYSSYMEISAMELCGEAFMKHYEENRIVSKAP